MFAARYFNLRHFADRYFPKGPAAGGVTYVRSHRYSLRSKQRIFVVAE